MIHWSEGRCMAVTQAGRMCQRPPTDEIEGFVVCGTHWDRLVNSAYITRRTTVLGGLQTEVWELELELGRLRAQRDGLRKTIARLTKKRDRLTQWLTSRRAIAADERRRIVDRCKRRCSYCKGQGTDTIGPDGRTWHIDHIVPFSEGGPTIPSNLTLACATCNISKGNRFLLVQEGAA